MITKEQMQALAVQLENHPDKIPVKEFTSHHFTDGLYIREMYLPKDTVLVGKEHLVENYFFLAAGSLTIWSRDGVVEIEAPWMGIVPVGAQRVGYAHEEVVCFNIIPNPTNETDIDKLEAMFFDDWSPESDAGTKDSFQSAAIVGAVAAVASVGMQAYGAAQAGKASKKAKKGAKERRQADLMQQFLERRKMLQEYRIAQAESLAGAVQSGADLESSGYKGVAASTQAQAEFNIRAEDRILKQEARAFKYDLGAAKLQSSASMWQTFGQIAGTVSSISTSYAGRATTPSSTGSGAGTKTNASAFWPGFRGSY